MVVRPCKIKTLHGRCLPQSLGKTLEEQLQIRPFGSFSLLEGVHSSSPTVMPGSGHIEVSELNIFYVAIIETNQECRYLSDNQAARLMQPAPARALSNFQSYPLLIAARNVAALTASLTMPCVLCMQRSTQTCQLGLSTDSPSIFSLKV